MSERDGWAHLYLYDGATGRGEEPDHEGSTGRCAASSAWTKRRGRSSFMRRRHRIRSRIPYFVQYYRVNFDGTGLTRADRRRRLSHRQLLAGRQVLRRHLVARRSRAVSELQRAADRAVVLRARARRPRRRCWRPAGARRRRSSPRAATARPTSTASSSGRPRFDPARQVSGHREHLRRAARIVRAEDVQRRTTACRRSPSSASSSCRSTAWAPRTARRRSTTSPGRT